MQICKSVAVGYFFFKKLEIRRETIACDKQTDPVFPAIDLDFAPTQS
jgi:hypothetical protein